MVTYLYNLPNATDGIDSIMVQVMSVSPALPALLLLFVFLTVFLGGSIRQSTKTGSADFSAWSVVASVSTLIMALLMSVNASFISLDWLIIVIVLNIGSATWFFLSRRQSEI